MSIFDASYILIFIPKLLQALPVTMEITIFAAIGGLVLGFFIAIVKIKKIRVLNQICGIYVSFMRGTPLLVQLFLSYYGLPVFLEFLNEKSGSNWDINSIPAIAFVFLSFSLNEAAYNSETIRSAILAVDKNEIEAGIAMGMTNFQIMRRITLPQALVVALPNLGNSFISLLKNTSLAFTVSVLDIMGASKVASGRNLRFFEVYIAAALIYWVVCILIEIITKKVEQKIDVKRKDIKKGGTGIVKSE